MNAPKLYFQKPLVREGKRYVKGKLAIRFGWDRNEGGPGYYAITRDLEAYFVPRDKYDWHAEFVCKVERDDEKAFDSSEDARRRGRFLWTPAAVQRSLVKLYALVRKDWESRCNAQETAQ